jgi:hypothetical protein
MCNNCDGFSNVLRSKRVDARGNAHAKGIVCLSVRNTVPSACGVPLQKFRIAESGATTKLTMRPVSEAHFLQVLVHDHVELMVLSHVLRCAVSSLEMTRIHAGQCNTRKTLSQRNSLTNSFFVQVRVSAFCTAWDNIG